MEIRRGDIFYISGGKTYAGYGKQSESGRPAIIVSNDLMNKTADYVEVVYLTTQDKKALPTHCEVVCKQKSTAMCETIYTINKDRIGDYVKSLTSAELAAVNECLMYSIRLSYISDFSEPIDRDYADLQDEIDTLRSHNDKLKSELAKMTEVNHHLKEQSDTSVAVERDLYKRLYEQLLDKAVS